MIDEQVKVHDKFSVELKVGFIAQKDKEVNDFVMNIWMFIPNGLDINRFTYSKSDFYRDLKSNIRLITPVYRLSEMIEGPDSPYAALQRSFREFAAQPNANHQEKYEFYIKMFMSILKSSLREEVATLKKAPLTETEPLVRNFCRLLIDISCKYRELYRIIDIPTLAHQQKEYYRFGDEFMSDMLEFHAFRTMNRLKNKDAQLFELLKPDLLDFISRENDYRKEVGYLTVEKGSRNHDLINRLSLLKKYIESHLYLNVDKRKDGMLVEQLLFSLAAGISMIFATAIAFSIQQWYGSLTMPLFVALVVSYMLKDRIKEATRYYFAHKMGKRYFDNKANIKINQTEIGWVKESIDFIAETKIPDEIVKKRACTSIIEANNRANSEKVMLYRTLMRIYGNKLDTNSEFNTKGVNSILRFSFTEFLRDMDNPEFSLYHPDDREGYLELEGEKLYYLNFIIQNKCDTQDELTRYRLALNRRGIQKIEKL